MFSMALLISNAILHTVGYDEHQVCFSDVELDIDSETCTEFIGRHVSRLIKNPAAKDATFSADSQVYSMIKAFQKDEIRFKELSRQICGRMAGVLKGNEDIPPADVLITFFDYGKNSYIAIIKLNYGECFVRKQNAGEGGLTENRIVKNSIVLPLSASSVEEACLIPYDPMVLRVLEKPHAIGGEDTFYFSKLFLECETQISNKEAVDAISEIAAEVNAKYFEGNIEVAAKIKTALIQEADAMDDSGLVLENIVDRAFEGNNEAKDEFVALAKEYSLPYQIPVKKSYVQRSFKTQHFKAENGVELKFPAELCQDPEQIQMIANPDGSYSITLNKLYPMG
jgi:nucleoid-associated protein YejK